MRAVHASNFGSECDGRIVHRNVRRAATVTGICGVDYKPLGHARKQLRTRLRQRLESGDMLERLDAGQTGGVYTVSDACSIERLDSPPMAVFKSDCEEGFMRRGITPGDGAAREEAAYLLDRMVGSVAGVPVTIRADVPVSVLGWKVEVEDKAGNGSLVSRLRRQISDQGHVRGAVQSFVPDAAGTAEDFGMPRGLDAAARVVSLAEAQQIASFDLRLCNTDRHSGNILFQYGDRGGHLRPALAKGMYRPVPIDHGCTLPRWWAMGEANFEAWADWPQVHTPCLPEVLDTVEDAFACREEAVQMLADLGVEPAAQATYYIAVTLLYEGTVRHGLTLAAVAGLLSRNCMNLGEPSWVEAQMVELSAQLGLGLDWTENRYGDRVPAPPSNAEAWPPEELLDHLLKLFSSDGTAAAGQQWQEDHGHLSS